MGLLQVHSDGLKLEEGESEFLSPVYAEQIHSREVRSPDTHTSLLQPASHVLLLPSVVFTLKLLSLAGTLSDRLANTTLSWSFSPHGVSSRPAAPSWTCLEVVSACWSRQSRAAAEPSR